MAVASFAVRSRAGLENAINEIERSAAVPAVNPFFVRVALVHGADNALGFAPSLANLGCGHADKRMMLLYCLLILALLGRDLFACSPILLVVVLHHNDAKQDE